MLSQSRYIFMARVFLRFQKPNNIFSVPKTIRNASRHRPSYFQTHMNLAEVVVHVVKGNRRRVVLQLLTERIRQPRESAHVHTHREILPLNEARGDVVAVGIAANDLRFNSDALWRAVARVGVKRRFSINLDQHRVVHIGTESILNRNQISPVAVGRDLYAMAKPSSQVVNELNGAVRIALANQPRRDNLRIGVDGNPSPHIAPSLGFLFGRRNLFFRTTKRPNFINLNSPTGQPAKHNVLHLAADSPISHSDRKTVFFATPVMRTVARTEVPSTKHRIT